MADDIRIRVGVDGAQEAQAELSSTAEGVRQVGASGADAAGGLDRQAVRTRDATQATGQLREQSIKLDDDAKSLASSILGQVDPALGQMFQLTSDAAEGMGALSGAVLGVAGTAAALGGVVLIYRQIAAAAEEARRANEALRESQRKMRDEGLNLQTRLAEGLRAAGASGTAREAASVTAGLMRRGIPEDLAAFGGVASQVFGLQGEGLEQLIAGAGVMEGGPPRLSSDRGEQQRIRDELMRLGAAPEARAHLEGLIRDFGPQAKRAAPPASAFNVGEQELDTFVERFARDTGLNEADAKRLRELLRAEGDLESNAVMKGVFGDLINPAEAALSAINQTIGPPGAPDELFYLLNEERPGGGTRTVEELVQLAGMARRLRAPGGARAPSRTPFEPTQVELAPGIGTERAAPQPAVGADGRPLPAPSVGPDAMGMRPIVNIGSYYGQPPQRIASDTDVLDPVLDGALHGPPE